jgi:glutathione S-transferase
LNTTQRKQIIEQDFAILDTQLGRYPFAAGEHFGIVDTKLFYVELWAPKQASRFASQRSAPLRTDACAALRRHGPTLVTEA